MQVSEDRDIFTVTSAIQPSFCRSLIDLFQKTQPCYKGKFGPRDGLLMDLDNKGFESWSEKCHSAFEPALALYRNHYRFYEKLISGGFKIAEYTEGQGCFEHYDGYTVNGLLRIQSVVVYLNDEFTSGETVFPRQNVSVKPETGKALFFPPHSSHLHSVRPPIGGTRYVLLSWLFLDYVPKMKDALRYIGKKPAYFP